ncbi:hypothetical protein glysoja_002762 [Glycine soja]|nr:hypothetical protein glysoja_002762 [Glycine soja]
MDINFTLLHSMNQCITFSLKKANAIWAGSTIYASPIPTVPELLWDHLVHISTQVTSPWVVMGDLNEITHPLEVRGRVFHQMGENHFYGTLTQFGLIDLEMIGGGLLGGGTFRGGGYIDKKLDRCMASAD